MRQLSDRYLRELAEMVAHGEISAAIAKRVRGDLYEPDSTLGHPPLLLRAVWEEYITELNRTPSNTRRLFGFIPFFRTAEHRPPPARTGKAMQMWRLTGGGLRRPLGFLRQRSVAAVEELNASLA